METPRPILDVENLDSPDTLRKKRKSAMKKALGSTGSSAGRVVSKYRARQTKLLGESDEDPYPYSPKYIFYCLDA
jgi:RNA-splicing ligase RtcB